MPTTPRLYPGVMISSTFMEVDLHRTDWRGVGTIMHNKLQVRDRAQATKHALAAYKWAWADGEPYVRRYELNKARAVLEKLGVAIPNLPHYDPAKAEKF